ncbi:F510_1955 family glycosylhydrolase [Domibacillus epiphyticus]|nr:glycosyl hydrolase [Domibacillus epiphyticus]
MKKTKKGKIIVSAVLMIFVISAAAMVFNNKNERVNENANEGTPKRTSEHKHVTTNISFDHIHGLGYTNDGNRLIVPAHDGLRIFEDERWKKSENAQHDYMGFSITDEGFFSSGHPAPDSDLKNPLGIVKSDELGAEIQTLTLYGEVDFHGMAAGYYSNAIYVMNPQPNSIMDRPGLFFSTDEAANWTNSSAKNVDGQAASLAVHPKNEKSAAIGTDKGAFLSIDNGNQFEQVLSDAPVSALSYTFDEKLLVGSMRGTAELSILDLESLEVKEVEIPSINEEEFITYIAANPKNKDVIAYSTSENNIYVSNDSGESWDPIAVKGKGVENK